MAADTQDGTEETDGNGACAETGIRRWLRPKPMAIFAAAIVVVILAGGGISYWIWGSDEDSASATIELGGPLVYHELPEFLVDLRKEGRRTHHLKLQIVAEVPENHLQMFTKHEIGVIDAVLAHLRTQTRADLTGEVGAERLRSNLLAIINDLIAPAQAKTILFKQFLMD